MTEVVDDSDSVEEGEVWEEEANYILDVPVLWFGPP